MKRLVEINSGEDIFPQYRDTPIALLLEYHNLGREPDEYSNAAMLIGMCMDHRKHLHIPDNFAYIIRSGGANLRYSEFTMSFAISVGNVKHMALIGHSDCGMVNLMSKKEAFIEGLVKNAGWTKQRSEEHFMHLSPMYEIDNAVDFVLNEVKRFRNRYPEVMIAPLFYRVEDNRLYLINED